MALSLISIGAKGTTLLQIQHALRLPTDSVTSMTAVTKMANSILVQNGLYVIIHSIHYLLRCKMFRIKTIKMWCLIYQTLCGYHVG